MNLSGQAISTNPSQDSADGRLGLDETGIGGQAASHEHVLPLTEGIFGAVPMPTLLLAADRSVIEANTAAHAMLAAHTVLERALSCLREPAIADDNAHSALAASLGLELARICDRAAHRRGVKVQHLHFGSTSEVAGGTLPVLLFTVTAIGSLDDPSLLCVIEDLGAFPADHEPAGDAQQLGHQFIRALGLTPAQARVAGFVARGAAPAQIAERLGVTLPTVRRNLRVAMQKMGVRNRHGLALIVLRVARRLREEVGPALRAPIGSVTHTDVMVDWV